MTYPISKLAYIGAGLDITPITKFDYVRTFIFVDTLPRCEFDDAYVDRIDKNTLSTITRFDPMWNHKQFIENLTYECSRHNMNKISEKVLITYDKKNPLVNPTRIVFANKKQRLIYYLSTNFRKDMTNTLKTDLFGTNGLILSGYFPHYSITDYLTRQCVLIAKEGSVFDYDEEDPDNIVGYLHRFPNSRLFYTIFLMLRSGTLLNINDMDHLCKITNSLN